MFGLSKETVDFIHGVFSGHPEVERVLIYGSRAKGSHSSGSDIDLVFQGENLRSSVISSISRALDHSSLPYMFDLSILCEIQNKDLIDHINRVGKVFYERKPEN